MAGLLRSMDAQRYDLSKRRTSSMESASFDSSHDDHPSPRKTRSLSKLLRSRRWLVKIPTPFRRKSCNDLAAANRSASREVVSALRPPKKWLIHLPLRQNSATETVLTDISDLSGAPVAQERKQYETTDTFEKDGYVVERHIIYHSPSRLSLFKPFSRPPTPFEIVRPETPLRRLSSLNCLNNPNSFEREVTHFRQECEREIPHVEVKIQQEDDIAVQKLEVRICDVFRRMDSRFGYVEVV